MLVQPHRVVLPLRMPKGALLTRLIIERGVNVTEVVTGMSRLTIYASIIISVL